MAFITDIEDALLKTLNDKLEVPVIIAYDNAPEPKGDYGILRFTAANKLHRNSISTNKTLDGLEEVIRQNYLLRFNVMFYGSACHDNAFLSQAILASSEVQGELYDLSHLSFADITQIQNNPEFRPTGFVARSVYDVSYLSGFEYKRSVDWFNNISYEGKYVSPDGRFVMNNTSISS